MVNSWKDVRLQSYKQASGQFPIGSPDSSKDVAVLNGRFSTGTAAGTTIDLPAAYTYSELWEIRAKVTSWTGIGTSFTTAYFRAEAGVASGGKDVRTIQAFAVANATFSVGTLSCAYFEIGIKASGAQTITDGNAIEGSIAPYTGTGAITITNSLSCLLLTPSGVSSRIDSGNAAKIHGIHLLARDGDGGSTKLGDGFKLENDSGQSGTRTLTNGINLAIGATTGVLIAGATTTGISITGATTNAFYVSGTLAGAAGRTFKGCVTVNNANYGDGYGVMESELTLTGTVAGLTAALSSWVNMITVTTGARQICAQTNGLYSEVGGVLTNGTFIFGMAMDCLLETNGGAGGATFYPFRCVNNTNVTSAIFLCNDASSDLGRVTNAGTDTGTLVPLYVDNSGKKYVKVYTLQ